MPKPVKLACVGGTLGTHESAKAGGQGGTQAMFGGQCDFKAPAISKGLVDVSNAFNSAPEWTLP